jgi:hypothetical protein
MYLHPSYYYIKELSAQLSQDPILRLLNLEKSRSRLERFFKVGEDILILKRTRLLETV